jgi:GT2 family glycosyltransferase
MQPLVSILVANFNGANLLPDFLKSLAVLSYENREVVVIDNGSTDDSLKILEKHSWVKVVRSDRNLGFAGGNNLGLKACSGELILLLNNDTIVHPGFLEPLCKYLEGHSRVGIVQGKMLLPRFDGLLDVCGSFLTAFGLPYHYGYYKPDGPKYQRSFPVFSAKGACLLFRRQVVSEAGGFLFDDDFFCFYEESDFCHRAWVAGWEVHFVDSPPTQHLQGGTSRKEDAAFPLRYYLRNMGFSLMSNLSFWSRVRILPSFFAMLSAGMVASAFARDGAQFRARWQAIAYCIRNYGKIRARRGLISSFRKQSDTAIFRKILRTPRFEYWVKTFTGKLRDYLDDELP